MIRNCKWILPVGYLFLTNKEIAIALGNRILLLRCLLRWSHFWILQPYTVIYTTSKQQERPRLLICEELLGISLSKELQCSDWSQRPLTEDQRTYAAIDALCLIEIFNVFQLRVLKEGL